jgi:hypothetical protein
MIIFLWDFILCPMYSVFFLSLLFLLWLFQNAKRLKAFSEKQLNADASPTLFPSSQKHTFEICSEKIHYSTLENFDISSLVIKMLGLPVTKTMDFKAKLDKLMLFEVDGQYTHTFDSEREFGKTDLSHFLID